MFLHVPNLRITSNFPHKMASGGVLRIIFLNFASTDHCLTFVIKGFKGHDCFRANIEGNIKQGLQRP